LGYPLLVLAAACGAGPPGSRPPGVGPNPVPIDWESPSGFVEVAGLEEARSAIPFSPLIPKGRAFRVFVSEPRVPLEDRGVLFLLRSSAGEVHWVIEGRSEIDQKDLEYLAELCAPAASSGCETHATFVTIRGGVRALLSVTARPGRVTGLMFLEDGLRVDVMGPSDTFTGEEAIAAAESLLPAGGG
jgi:hypothetical protein